ncbi:ROK family protein [Candidatus Curtissbacteria bacterium]|nr:ROK family protein [Candidatus Curtissbacteria bacterium]
MFLVFDIGGTNMRLAVSRDGKSLEEPKILKTPKDFDEGMLLFKKTVLNLSDGEKIKAAAGGIAGPLDGKKEMLVNSPNLPGWIKKPLKKTIEKFFGAPIFIENDAAIVGLGEALVGAGIGYAIVAYITVSTGVGGARIVDGKIDRNKMGFEPGHQIIEINGPLCPRCGIPGHLEGYVSGTALWNKYGKPPQDITDKKIWDEVAYYLTFGVHNSLLHWSPDVIVLGGSMMKSISLEKVTENLDKILTIFPKAPLVKRAELGDKGGLYGALAMAKQHYE